MANQSLHSEGAMEPELFNTATYDLAGTPKLNGRKARTITLAFDAFELDHTDSQHMELVGKLELGVPINLTVAAVPGKRTWNEHTDDDLRCALKITITDIA